MTLKLTKDNFKTEVLDSSVPVMVDFWAEWCGPCRMIAPVIDELAAEISQTAKVGKVNVNEEMELAQEYGVMVIPTIIVFKNGEIVNRAEAFMDKDALKNMLG